MEIRNTTPKAIVDGIFGAKGPRQTWKAGRPPIASMMRPTEEGFSSLLNVANKPPQHFMPLAEHGYCDPFEKMRTALPFIGRWLFKDVRGPHSSQKHLLMDLLDSYFYLASSAKDDLKEDFLIMGNNDLTDHIGVKDFLNTISVEPDHLTKSFLFSTFFYVTSRWAGLDTGFSLEMKHNGPWNVHNWIDLGSGTYRISLYHDAATLHEEWVWVQNEMMKLEITEFANKSEKKWASAETYEQVTLPCNDHAPISMRTYFALWHFIKAENALNEGKYEDADRLYQLALELDPSDPFDVLHHTDKLALAVLHYRGVINSREEVMRYAEQRSPEPVANIIEGTANEFFSVSMAVRKGHALEA